MSVTVNWLLNQHHISDCKLLAGDTSQLIPITGVNVMDNPDTVPWLAEGTLVLSTGYLFMDETLTKDLIKNLSEKGCAGLGIKMNRYIKKLPMSMIQQADALHFPIFNIPFSSSMNQITDLLYRKMFAEEMSEAERLALVYKDISETVLKKQSAAKLPPIIGKALNTSVFLTNDSFEILEFYTDTSSKYTFPFPFSHDSYILFSENDVQYLKSQYTNTHLPYLSLSVPVNTDIIEFDIFPIANRNSLLGFLILLKANYSTDAFNFISNIQTILCITMMNHAILTESERSSRDIFFKNLLSGQYSSSQEIESLCIQNQFDFKKERICLTFLINGYEQLTIAQRRAFERKVFALFEDAYHTFSVQVIKTVFQTHFVLFIFLDQIKVQSISTEFGIQIAEKCIEKLKKNGIASSVGISKNANNASTIILCYKQALQALETGPLLHPKEVCFSYYNDQIYYLLMNNFTHVELTTLYNESLGILEKYDAMNNAELLHTLEIYLKLSGNVTQTAKQLFIHRNTMFYRLDQIKELLHLDLNNADTIYQLQTAFYIKKILNQ